MGERLTATQARYVWLAGAYPDRVLVQGRGKRSPRLLYAINRPGEIVVFGYGNPMMWLVNRGLFRGLQARNTYTLTEKGEAEFRRLLSAGAGLKLNKEIRETTAQENRDEG